MNYPKLRKQTLSALDAKDQNQTSKYDNSELLGAYGNFINRNLAFIDKYFDSKVPNGTITNDIEQKISDAFVRVGNEIENTSFRDALDEIFELVRYGNKYFDTEKPWETRNSNISACENTIFNCIQLIANLAVLLSPFLPFSSEKVSDWLNLKSEWKLQSIDEGYILPKTDILFERLDKGIVEDELSKLRQ